MIRYNKSVIDCFLEQQLLSSDPVNTCIILTGQYFSILTRPDQYNVFFRILSELVFMRPSRDGPYYVIGYGGRASTQVSAQ